MDEMIFRQTWGYAFPVHWSVIVLVGGGSSSVRPDCTRQNGEGRPDGCEGSWPGCGSVVLFCFFFC